MKDEKILVDLNCNDYNLYDIFVSHVPELKKDKTNWRELMEQVFICFSNNALDLMTNRSKLLAYDRFNFSAYDSPDFQRRFFEATEYLCLGVVHLCNDLGLYKNSIFNYTVVKVNGNILVFVKNIE